MSKTVLYLIIGAAAVLALVVVLIAVLSAKKRSRTQQPRITEESVQPVPELDRVIVEGIRNHALRFIGLYEGIYAAVQANSSDVPDAYTEWHIRLGNLREDEDFCQHFCTRFPRDGAEIPQLQELLQYMEAAGVQRMPEGTHRAGPQTREQYIYMGADELCIGKEYRIFKPCWLQNGITVQQGMLIPMEGL